MAPDNSKGPLYSHGWDEREEERRRRAYESNWEPDQNNANREDNRNRGGYTGTPGSNYAAGSFAGIGEGMGYEEDNYRGYYGGSTSQSQGFANYYAHAYGRDDYHRPTLQEKHRPEALRPTYTESGMRPGQEAFPPQDRFPGSGRAPWKAEREEGPYRGKGPKNYRRSDTRICEDINDILSDDAYLDATHVQVKVHDGNVVLSGHVENRDARRRAVALAESVRGVTNVESHLRTGQGIIENISKAITAAIGDVTLGHTLSTVESPRKGRKKKGG